MIKVSYGFFLLRAVRDTLSLSPSQLVGASAYLGLQTGFSLCLQCAHLPVQVPLSIKTQSCCYRTYTNDLILTSPPANTQFSNEVTHAGG